jgi:hypothetical protein
MKANSGGGLIAELAALWKDADPNVPVLKPAKAEHATLC